MKVPQKPPPLVDLLAKDATGPFDMATLIALVPEGTIDGKYLHWDDLRHRTPPVDLSLRQWWLALKFARMSSRKETPLRDVRGGGFSFALVDPLPERLHDLDLKAGGTIGVPEAVINPDTKNQYLVRSLIEESITSSQLEGAATTREVARDMIRGGRSPRDRSERMILNNYRTMERIVELREEPLTRELVLEIQRMVTEDTLDDPSWAGRLRRDSEYRVVGDDYGNVYHEPPPASALDARLEAMLEFANGQTPRGFTHPAIRAVLLHFWLAYDHPFVDGNGRTARALFYWCMLKNGYWLFEYLSISQIILKAPARYGRAFLETETDDNDLTYFLLYHMEVIRRATEELNDYIHRRTRQLSTISSRLRGIGSLNHRQRDLIAHAVRHPGQSYTIREHQASHKIVYQTARKDLLTLADDGLLMKRRVGNEFVFDPAPDLEERLRRSN